MTLTWGLILRNPLEGFGTVELRHVESSKMSWNFSLSRWENFERLHD